MHRLESIPIPDELYQVYDDIKLHKRGHFWICFLKQLPTAWICMILSLDKPVGHEYDVVIDSSSKVSNIVVVYVLAIFLLEASVISREIWDLVT